MNICHKCGLHLPDKEPCRCDDVPHSLLAILVVLAIAVIMLAYVLTAAPT